MSAGITTTSPSRLSQPVRAITSTLSARTAPPVPPASQTYEPLARAVLRRRLLYDILPLSILPLWTSTIFWRTWNAGGISALSVLNALLLPILPSTLLLSTFVWALGVLPIIVLRKSQLTGVPLNRNFWRLSYIFAAVPTPSSSPSQCVKVSFSKPRTLRALSVYILTSILISTSHIVFGRVVEGTSRGGDHFGVFVKSRYLFTILGTYIYRLTSASRKHPYYLNGSFLFLFMAQVTLAVFFHFRSILLDRVAVRWRHSQACLSFKAFAGVMLNLPLTGSKGRSHDRSSPPSHKHQYHYLCVHRRYFRSIHPRLWARACRSTPNTIPDPLGLPSPSSFPWSLYPRTMEPRSPLAEPCTCLADLLAWRNYYWGMGICRGCV